MEIICLDSNILIDFWRDKSVEKSSSVLLKLSTNYSFAVSSIVVYELLKGDKSDADIFWNNFFSNIKVLPFELITAQEASRIYHLLKSKGKIIGVEDILIAATAIHHKLKLATLNKKHFENIEHLNLIEFEHIV
jgi:tRNA(fMet)-specific endonuclease VapC